MCRSERWWVFILGLLCLFSTHAVAENLQQIQDILDSRCVMCHSGPQAPLGLQLDSLENLVKGSDNGPVVIAGDPENSELMRRLTGTSQPRMPMTGPPYLTDAEVALFSGWIAKGMPAAQESAVKKTSAPPGELTPYDKVAALFGQRCVKCHSDNGQMGAAPEGYRLTSYAEALTASERVRIVPGYPEASVLVRHITGQMRPRMPFDGPPYLSAQEIKLVVDWIRSGAPDAEGRLPVYPLGAKLRLNGVLSSNWRLDGGPELDVDNRTRIDKSPRAGDFVEVRGRIGAAGTVLVERLRRR